MLRASQSASCQNRVAHTYRYRDKESDFLFFLAGFFWPKQWRARSAAWQMKWRRKSKKPLKVNFFYDCYCRLLLVGVFFSVLVFGFGFGCDVRFLFAFCLLFTYDRWTYQFPGACVLPSTRVYGCELGTHPIWRWMNFYSAPKWNKKGS